MHAGIQFIDAFLNLTLRLQSFLYPPLGTELIFYMPSPGTEFFGFCVSRAENWSSAPSTTQCKCIYAIFKAPRALNQVIQFPLLCTKPSIDKHKFLSFKGC